MAYEVVRTSLVHIRLNRTRRLIEHVAHDVLWRVVQDELPHLEKICRQELAAKLDREHKS